MKCLGCGEIEIDKSETLCHACEHTVAFGNVVPIKEKFPKLREIQEKRAASEDERIE